MASKSKYDIDYSKWDNLDVTSSSNEEDVDEHDTEYDSNVMGGNQQHAPPSEPLQATNQPRVTRFEAPQRITIGGTTDGDACLTVGEMRGVSSSSPPSASDAAPHARDCVEAAAPATAAATRPKAFSKLDMELWSANGGVCAEYCWRQERYTVDFLLILPRYIARTGEPLVKYRDVVDRLPLSDGSEQLYEEVTAKKLSVEIKNYGQTLDVGCQVSGSVVSPLASLNMKFEVKEDEDDWIWELVRVQKEGSTGEHPFGARGVEAVQQGKHSAALSAKWCDAVLEQRPTAAAATSSSTAPTLDGDGEWLLLCVFMKKVVKIPGLTVWWRCVFSGENEEGLDVMKSRNEADKRAASQFEANWNEAHKCFLEKHSKQK